MPNPYGATVPIVGPLEVEDTLELDRLIRAFCTLMCRQAVAAGDPLAAAPYFVVARRPLPQALELFAALSPAMFRVLVDEAIHPGGGV